MKTTPNIKTWQDQIPQLWFEVCYILKYCVEAHNSGISPQPDAPEILEFLSKKAKGAYLIINKKKVRNPYYPSKIGIDRHLHVGLTKTEQERYKIFPRIAYLTINAFQEAIKVEVKSGYMLPSPMGIIYSFLTDPRNPSTAAHSLSACRNWLAEVLGIKPVNNIHNNNYKLFTIDEQKLETSIISFSHYVNIGMRWPDSLPELHNNIETGSMSILHNFVGHFLASRGIAHLWFAYNDKDQRLKAKEAKEEKTPQGQRPSGRFPDHSLIEFLDFSKIDRGDTPKKIALLIKQRLHDTFFRLSKRYRRVPQSDEIANQLFGFPIPIRGMDVVFNGGLRPSSSGGLVISISGDPGTGKTSLSLALANALAPFKTATYFLSLEETETDIIRKLKTLSPDYQSNFSITPKTEDYFSVLEIKDKVNFKELSRQMIALTSKIELITKNKKLTAGYCPGLVIVDNLNGIAALSNGQKDNQHKSIYLIEKIIKACREVNAITILVSADDLPRAYRIDYLSDVVIDLRYDDLDKINERPIRIFNLIKTRHQLARQGSHVFHIGHGKGFRIVPHMDSLMDRREVLKRQLPDQSRVIHALNYEMPIQKDILKPIINRYIDLFPGSNILLHGLGSGGKAGLALKLLLTPPVDRGLSLEDKVFYDDYSGKLSKRRVLIISFLYGKEYYEELIKKLNYSLSRENLYNKLENPDLDFLILYPGFLGPQDFLNKVITRVDEARLDGNPFTGIMIDGLHNVFLQYERLQKADMVWAMLYSILSRYDLTVVSTFTNFSLSDKSLDINDKPDMPAIIPDHMLMQQGMTPFLHALVKATDFHLNLQEVITENNERKYVLSTRSAIGQKVPSLFLEWDRIELEIRGPISQQEAIASKVPKKT